MRKSGLMVAALGTLVVFLSACGSSSPSAGSAYGSGVVTQAATPTTASGSGAMSSQPKDAILTIKKTKIGYVLANAQGYTLYWYSKDVKDSGRSDCTSGCLTAWPALTGKPVAESGIKLNGTLGTITRPGGTVQATYNGYPLYRYASDMSPGAVLGNGAGGVWHVITGKVLTSSAPASSGGSGGSGGSGSSGGSGGSGGGYGY
jgi:predicted lipoprotein with Yx(FWY)xxD motif